MVIRRCVPGFVLVGLLLGCQAKRGDWEKSRESLCDEIDLGSQEVTNKFPRFEKDVVDASSKAEAEYAGWNDASCDRKILVARRRTELCGDVVREATEQAAEIRGLWSAASIVASGRPDGTESIGLGLGDVHAMFTDVCQGDGAEARSKAAIAKLREDWTGKLTKAIAECKAQGWQSKIHKGSTSATPVDSPSQ